MKTLFIYSLAVISMVMYMKNSMANIAEPKAKIIPHKMTIHGHTRVDDYFWLNDRKNPEVKKYLEEENAFTKKQMFPTEPLQNKIFNEITGRIKKDDNTAPVFRNGFYYYMKHIKGKEHPILIRKKDLNIAKEEILIDGNELAKGHAYFKINAYTVSDDSNFLAYSVDLKGRYNFVIHIKDLKTGKTLPEVIPFTSWGTPTWASDNKTIFYSKREKVTLRTYRIMKHTLGNPASSDKVVFEEKDDTFSVGVNRSKSGKYIFINSYQTEATEVQLLESSTPNGKFKVMQPRQKGVLYSAFDLGGEFLIKTNYKAPNFRLMKAPMNKLTIKNWKEFKQHQKDVFISEVEVFKNSVVTLERKEGLGQIRIRDLKSNLDSLIPFKESAYATTFGKNPDFNSDKVRFIYESFTTPKTTYDFDLKSQTKKLIKREAVVGGHDPSDYHTDRIHAKAHDDEIIPITLVYKKSLYKEGKNPLLLYGYGSYGTTILPWFNSPRLSLLNRGVVYAVAHTRGSQTKGRKWYEAGRLLNKKNTFKDYISVAEHLVAKKYTHPKKLFATGRSAGGLLMGTIYNMRPDLFRGVIAGVPFVDIVTTMLDDTIPLTTFEYDEWGNPNNKKFYDYMLSYSPYDNVKSQDYPSLLVTTGFHDSQVQYWEPAKWVAKIRANNTNKSLVLLKTDMDVGHGGKGGRFERYRQTALQFAFLLKLSGITN